MEVRDAHWDRTSQACCRGPARAGCQEWLRGPSGTSLRHFTSALQLSLARDPVSSPDTYGPETGGGLKGRGPHEPVVKKRQAEVSPPSPVHPHHGENASKWSSETLPEVALTGKRVFKERSGRVPDQQGPRARWHITASLCAAIPRMRHCGVGKFASDQRGGGVGVI
ncbi:unnamed protein product [Pleuronectes platessa]|uniref:Uncharacterized protein n=1 Tax=Pleuronectes platessa TaxID=8262 RepID=A0A9N7ULR4_PLEPL|nr:unnamed protein product [Pleuronectes platessa]